MFVSLSLWVLLSVTLSFQRVSIMLTGISKSFLYTFMAKRLLLLLLLLLFS